MVVIAVASGGATACNSSSTVSTPCGGPPTVAHVEIDRPAPPPTEFRIERCEVDVGACLDLCEYVETGADSGNSNGNVLDPPSDPAGVISSGPVASCTAGFVGDSKVELNITLETGCLPEQGGPVGGG